MPSEGFEVAIPAIKRLETYVLDRTVTGTGGGSSSNNNNNDNRQAELKMCATGKQVLIFARNCLF